MDFHGEIVPTELCTGANWLPQGLYLEEYLEEYGIPDSWKYPVGSHDIVDGGQWLSKDDSVLDAESEKYVPVNWRSCIDGYIDDVDEDTVLVSVDYHM